MRPFGLEFNASMQLQPKVDGNHAIDFSMYQKQLAFMTQKLAQKPEFGQNLLQNNVDFKQQQDR